MSGPLEGIFLTHTVYNSSWTTRGDKIYDFAEHPTLAIWQWRRGRRWTGAWLT